MTFETDRRTFGKGAALLSAGALAVKATTALPAAAQPAVVGQAGAAPTSPGEPVPLAPPDRQPPNLKLPEVVPKKAGWAVVGLGQLSVEEILPAFGGCALSRPTAFVSGHPDKAKQLAQVYGVDPATGLYDYENFDRIATNPAIDIVYIVLPNSMHAEFTIRALKAGKHVLCEKPMAVSVEECEAMNKASQETGRKLMIAYRLHFEPLNQRVMDICKNRELGVIKTFSSSNCQNVEAPNIRLSSKLGGGPVGDVGVYSIQAACYTIGEDPISVTAIEHRPTDDPRFREVPESVAFTLHFPSGAVAHCDSSFGTAVSRRYRAHGSKGWIDMDPAFAYSGLKLSIQRGDEKKGTAERAEQNIEQVNQFSAEMDHFSDCVLNGKDPKTPGSMGLRDQKIVSAIAEAGRTGGSVQIV